MNTFFDKSILLAWNIACKAYMDEFIEKEKGEKDVGGWSLRTESKILWFYCDIVRTYTG